MNNKGIKAVSTAIVDPIILDTNTAREDVDLFLFGLFIENGIPDAGNSPNSLRILLEKMSDGAILRGGLMFYENDIKILPGCCSWLEEWSETVENIMHRKHVWLGHDPYPTIEYTDSSVIIWSDDIGRSGSAETKDDLKKIEYTYDEINDQLAQVKIDIKEFIEFPYCERLNEIDSSISDNLVFATKKWLNIDYFTMNRLYINT